MYICETCDYNTNNKYDYKKHLSTDKQKLLIVTDKKSQEIAKTFDCLCGKFYKHIQSLLNHKKNVTNPITNKSDK